jgi:hypothetical protein
LKELENPPKSSFKKGDVKRNGLYVNGIEPKQEQGWVTWLNE